MLCSHGHSKKRTRSNLLYSPLRRWNGATRLNVYPRTLFHRCHFVYANQHVFSVTNGRGVDPRPTPLRSRGSRLAGSTDHVVGFVSHLVNTQHIRGAGDARGHTGDDDELVTDLG